MTNYADCLVPDLDEIFEIATIKLKCSLPNDPILDCTGCFFWKESICTMKDYTTEDYLCCGRPDNLIVIYEEV